MPDIMNAVCGPRCDKCPSYIATKSGDRDALQRIANEWTEAMGRTFTAGDILCDGCRVEGAHLSSYCDDCDIRLCALSKDNPTCAHCSEYPCDKIHAPQARQALDEIRAALKL